MRRAWAYGRRSGSAISSESLRRNLVAEASAIDRRVRATIRGDAWRGGIAFPEFQAMQDWPQVRARFRLDEERHPHVKLGIGTMLAIDDLVLFAATLDSFLIPSREAIRLAPPGRYYKLAHPCLELDEFSLFRFVQLQIHEPGMGKERWERFIDTLNRRIEFRPRLKNEISQDVD